MKTKVKNETKVTCPKCGAQFEIAEKTHVTIGVVIGKDAGLGTVHPKVVGQDAPERKLPSKASERIEALRAVGVDVSNYFSVMGANGGEFVARNDSNGMKLIADDDPIYDAILKGGDVYNWKLARRWVMAQMFRMFANEEPRKYGGYDNSITEQIRRKGYDYMWKQMQDELYAQYKMFRNGDIENFRDRNHWFNKNIVYAMLEDYRYQLHLYIKHGLKAKKCKGVPYKHICGKDVFVADIDKKVFEPIRKLQKQVENCSKASELYSLVRFFNEEMRLTRAWRPKQSADWVDAYKGAGAFFTIQNLVRYHGYRFNDVFGNKMSKDASYCELGTKNLEYKREGWRMIGVLRQFLKDNNVDIEKKMAEWRKK